MHTNLAYNMTNERVVELLAQQEFTFAKTMANIPHSYTVRKNWKSDKDFVDVVLHMREHGIVEFFFKKPYVYFYANGYKYWTMGNDMTITRIINRAKV